MPRPLNVANGYLRGDASGYIGDAPPYDGVVTSSASRLSRRHHGGTFNSLCSLDRRLPGPNSRLTATFGNCWARGGAVVDPDPSMNGRVYAATGNGDFSANVGGHNYGTR